MDEGDGDGKDEAADDTLNKDDENGIDDERTEDVTETTRSTDKSITEAFKPTVELATTEGDKSDISIGDPRTIMTSSDGYADSTTDSFLSDIDNPLHNHKNRQLKRIKNRFHLLFLRKTRITILIITTDQIDNRLSLLIRKYYQYELIYFDVRMVSKYNTQIQ